MWPFSRRPKQPQYAPGSMPGDVLFGAPAPDDDQRAILGVPWGQGWNPVARPVDVDRALSLAPVYGCARVLADTIASLPIDVYRRSVGDQIELPRPALFTQPATFGTLFDWVHRCITSLALRGNAFGLITGRDYLGFPTSIEWLNPDDVMVTDTLLQGPGSFLSPLWYVQGKPAPAEDIFHVPWFTVPWRVLGLSPLGLFAANINVGLAGGQYALDWFSNGGVPPGVMNNTESTVTREEADIITSRVTSRIREHKPLVLGRDWNYTPIAINPQEARFVESARLTATQIATIYGVDPTMVGGEIGGSFTYSNTEQLGLKQLVYTFGPWISRLEAALSTLFPRGTFVKFKPDGLLRTDAATRWQVYKTAVEIGAMTVPEIRQLEDLPELKPSELPQPQPKGPSQQPAGQQSQPSTAPANEPPDQPTNGQQPTPSPNGRRPVPAGGRQHIDALAEPPWTKPEIRQHYLPPDPWKHVPANGNGWKQPH